jgi:hypothetical protein
MIIAIYVRMFGRELLFGGMILAVVLAILALYALVGLCFDRTYSPRQFFRRHRQSQASTRR